MKKCRNCGNRILFGAVAVPDGDFCSSNCLEGFQKLKSGFCEKCREQTTADTAGNLRQFNGIGTAFGPFSKDKCPECGSVIKTKWFTFGLPLVPLEKYRVLYTMQKGALGGSRASFLSRRLNPPSAAPVSSPSASKEAEHNLLVQALNGKMLCTKCASLHDCNSEELSPCCQKQQVRFRLADQGQSCSHCGFKFTHEQLGVDRKMRDIFSSNGFYCSHCGKTICLKCTLKNESDAPSFLCTCGKLLEIRI
jgi:hypothetical protein